jgi:hypothetical protein
MVSGVIQARRSPRVRLTRRGRAVVLAGLLAMHSAAGVLLATAARDAGDGPRPGVVTQEHAGSGGRAPR